MSIAYRCDGCGKMILASTGAELEKIAIDQGWLFAPQSFTRYVIPVVACSSDCVAAAIKHAMAEAIASVMASFDALVLSAGDPR